MRPEVIDFCGYLPNPAPPGAALPCEEGAFSSRFRQQNSFVDARHRSLSGMAAYFRKRLTEFIIGMCLLS